MYREEWAGKAGELEGMRKIGPITLGKNKSSRRQEKKRIKIQKKHKEGLFLLWNGTEDKDILWISVSS